MISKNEDIELMIEGYTSDGTGVGRVDSMAVFVPGTIKGERVRAHVIKVYSTYAVAKCSEVLLPSICRCEPACKSFGRCGGCAFMHMNYDEELSLKHARVVDAFGRIGGFNVAPNIIVPSPAIDGYRNKAQFPCATDEVNQAFFGFYSARSHKVIPIDDCRLISTNMHTIQRIVEMWMNKNGVTPYNEQTGEGLVRHLFIREGQHTGEIQICLVINGCSLPHQDRLINMLMKQIDNIVSIVVNVNKASTNVIMGKSFTTIYGKDCITDRMFDVRFEVSPASFYQVNTLQAEQIYALVMKLASCDGNDSLIDMYCGAGTIGLSCANMFNKIIGVEIVPQAVKNARKNADINGITNARFICADATKAGRLLIEDGVVPDAIIVDPPRKGCDRTLLDNIVLMNPKRIIYVSCNPATVARDCSILCQNGYVLCEIHPFDMFPRTAHVETVCLLMRNIECK